MSDESTRRVVVVVLLASGVLLTLAGIVSVGSGRSMVGVALLIAGVADLGLAALMGRLIRPRLR